MAYGYYGNKRGRKQSRSKTKQLEVRRILASLAMAAGIFAYPFGVSEATTITPKDASDATKITHNQNGDVYTIEPQKVNTDFAYNRFSAFSLDAGHIANLNFGSASTLANLVNSRIDINGTVNAIKNNTIGGHLYFLSPDGIAVGATGVINAGQFTGIVPTKTAFETMYNSTTPDTAITKAAIDNITSYANDKTINISGQVNTHSGVMLGAGIININDGAKIHSTKDLNFTNLVNISGGASSGLTGLNASAGTGGDIIIAAKQTSAVKDTKTENNTTTANPIRWKERSTDLSAAINIGKDATTNGVEISSSDGAVKLTAESTSTYEDSTPMTLTDTLKTAIFGEEQTAIDGLVDKLAKKEAGTNKYLFVNYSNKKNKSSVNIGQNSAITGKNIDIAATSKVEIKQSLAGQSTADKTDSNGQQVQSGSKVIAAVAVSRVYNNADIVIDGNLTATGADTNGSGIKIAANADTKAALSAAGNGGDANAVAVGVAVLAGDTKAKVTVNEGATNAAALSAAQGKASVEAVTKSDVDVKVNAAGATSYVVSNVGVANYDTSADVIINRSITAGAVDIKAENKITGLKLTVDNTADTSAPGNDTEERNDTEDNTAASGESQNGQRSIDPTQVIRDASINTNDTTDNQTQDAAGAIQNVQNRVAGTNESGTSGNSGSGNNSQQNSAFGLGASVGVFSNKNDANVTIGKNAVITAAAVQNGPDGSVNINAKSIMTASTEHEDTLQFTVKNSLTNANGEIGAAVIVSNVKNNATILLDSGADENGTMHAAQITGAGAVSLNAAAGMGKYTAPPENEEGGNSNTGGNSGNNSGGDTNNNNGGDTGNNSGGDTNNNNDNGNTGDTDSNDSQAEEKTSTLTYAVSAEGTAGEETPSTFALSGSVGVNTLKNNAIVLLGQNSQVAGTGVTLSSDTTTNAEGTYGAEDANTKVGLGASVGIQNIRNNSLVMAGKGARITGTESLEASANNSMELKNSVKNAGKGYSVGISGMVALSYGDSNSIVSLDDEVAINAPAVSIESSNSTNVDNSARSNSTSNAGSKAFGIGVGIINYDVNSIAMVGDNGSGIPAPSGNTTDVEKAAQKIYKDAQLARDVAGTTLAGKLGAATSGTAKGSITTGDLDVSATTTGMLKNDAKANANAKDSTSGDDDSEKWTNWSSQGTQGADEARRNTQNLEQDNVTSQNESAAPTVGDTTQTNNASGAMSEASREADPEGTNNTDDEGTAPAAGSSESAGASIGIEGSAALTFLGGRTDAVLDNVTVRSGMDPENLVDSISVSVDATDFLGSITLGGTSVKNTLQADDSTHVGIGGTFAMNNSNRDVDSFVRNSTIEKAGYLSNSASKIGIEVAAGMGLSTSTSGSTNVSGAGVVYYNKAKQDVHALLINNNVTSDFLGNVLGLGMLSNEATSTDFQIAGGLAATTGGGSGTNVGVGGAVAISNLENNLSSGIIGGSYTNFSSIDVEAQKGTTQINGAVAGAKTGYGFNGAFAYGSVKNTTHAYISDNATVGGDLTGSVNVRAGEVPVVKTETTLTNEQTELTNKQNEVDGKTKLTDNAKTRMKKSLEDDTKKSKEDAEQAGKNKTTLTNASIDTTGRNYLFEGEEQSSLDDDAKSTDEGKIADEAAADEDKAKGLLGQNHSITITAAMAGGLASDVGAGAGIAYNYVKNDIAADIKGSTITAGSVTGEASSDSLIVSVGAGVAVGGKTFNGAGSGSWNDLKNDTKVTFANNTIATNNISEEADNTSSIINIAGEVAGGKGMAMGLSLAYNSLNNTTGTYLTGNDIDMEKGLLDLLLGGDNSVRLATTNKSNALAVAGGVDVNISQSAVGAVGTVAINRGVNHTESVIDGKADGTKTTLDDVKTLSVTASELTKKTTVAGGVSVGGKKVGIGGAVAYSAIGSSGNKERLRAEINHADITTTADGTISVSTTDSKTTAQGTTTTTEKSRITTVGAGIGVSWGKNFFNLQGAAAVSDIYKDSLAALNNTNINAKEGYTGNHPAISVTADTKSKINTVGAVGNIDVGSAVKGIAGVAINRMDQDTKAEMATDSGTTTVNSGLTEVRAVGDGDIHSVGAGGTVAVGGFVAFSGSGSYNYIGNDVNAIIKNQNLTSDHSVGVVAQSDDRLYNFAGGFAIGAGTKAGLGAAVGINKITGNTNALAQGGSIAAADNGTITVSRPQDSDLYKAESLDVRTNSQKLSENRKKETKSGVVVDSSATHTIISQMSAGGVAATTSFAVKLDGTVNINTIEGNTTAKIQDAALNSADNASNINVNAIDYANLSTFTGTPAIAAAAAAGVSVGVSANWETLNRTTEAEISSTNINEKKNIYANNLTVDALAKHGSSSLSFAAAAGAGKVGVSSGDSIMRHKNTSTTLAKLDRVNATYDGTAEVRAEHLGNSHSQNISVSASGGMVAVSAGAGVSVMDDTSTVKAEVADSDLKAKSSVSGKNISVLAKNENHWKETLVTASLAVGIGGALAANVGIHNTTGETAALVTNSNLEAYDVTVKATDIQDAISKGGVGAGGVGGVGVAVTLNNINSSVSAHVTGGSVKAAHDIDVAAEETRSFDSQVTGASAGGIGVGVNVAVTSINKGITDAQLSNAQNDEKNMNVNATTQSEINKHLASVNGAKGTLGDNNVKFAGLSVNDSDLNAARNVQVILSTPDTDKQGVHTSVNGASMTADNDVNVKATDTSDIFAKNIGVTAAGAASVNVTDAIIHTNYDTDVTLTNATVTGKNVNINALQTQAQPNEDGKQGSDVRVTAVTVGALGGVGVGYAGIVNRGSTDIDITGSTIQATGNSANDKGVTIKATDESKHKSQILSVGVAALNVTTTFASVENYSNVGITLNDMKDSENNIISTNISAAKNVAIDAKKANTLEAHTQGVGVGGVNVAVNHATIEDGGKDGNRDTGITAAKITGTNGAFSADKFHLGATNDTTAKISAGNVAVSVLGISTMRGKGVMNMGAEVDVAGGRFNAKTVEFSSMLGNSNGRTIEGNVKGHNISVGAVAPDTVRLETTATGKVNVQNSTFGEDTDLILDNESYVDRKAYIYDVTVGGVAVGNSRAIISGTETLETTLTGKTDMTNKLANLLVATYGENTGKALADAGGGGLVGYVGAHVKNQSTNNVTSSLSGKWDLSGEAFLVAAQKDETRLTAKEGHGGVIGVGGTSVENTIETTTNAKVDKNTEITADRVHVGTGNSVTTGAYDDKDGNGNTDVQTYTLQDHFGGVIAGNRLRSLLKVTENGTVTIDEGAKITTNKLQEYIATSNNNLVNNASAKGGGAVGIVDAVSENILTINNTVDVQSGVVLSNEKAASTEGIILSAYDEHNLKAHVEATVGGAVGVLVSKNLTTMDRRSTVNVKGDIESGAQVGLYAGANEDGVLSNLKADLKAGTYNHTAIPVGSPTVRYNKDGDGEKAKDIGSDMGTVDVSGTVRSAGDINVTASGGREEIIKDASLFNWVKGGNSTDKTFLSSDAVSEKEMSNQMKKNTVTVTGSLIAGTGEPINVTVDNSVLEGLTITTPDNKANNRVKAGITEGVFDYANTLGARLEELNKLISSYVNNNEDNESIMASYMAERTRIQNKMVELGLAQKDANGNVTGYSSSGRPVYYVEIPDIATSGGNINVKANDLIGTGYLHANSAPSITITNNSDAYLKLNNILMGENGGSIVYNEKVIPPDKDTGNTEINKINVQTNGAAFKEIYGRSSTTEPGTAAGLLVSNTRTFSGGKTSTITLSDSKKAEMKAEVNNDNTLSDDDKTRLLAEINNTTTVSYTAIPDVEVNGKISNFYGNVTINNASGDIRISGGTTNRPTGVEGNTVSLVASNGTIAQDYKEGIVNINGDPEKFLKDTVNAVKDTVTMQAITQDYYPSPTVFPNWVIKVRTNDSYGTTTTTYDRSSDAKTATGYIAGRDVYVAASNVNVNGLIQSGYKNYIATVSDTDLAEAQKRSASLAAVVQNRTMYKVNDGGAKWNETEKMFDYVPQVYWDPSTNKLVVEDIETSGGKVYLTGMIASTGDGRILAAEGAADISVVNNTALDMNVGSVLNNRREGIITIADTAKDTWTEYRRGKTRTIQPGYDTSDPTKGYAAFLKEHAGDGDPYYGVEPTNNNLSIGTNNTLSYNVKLKQEYSWISGKTTDTVATYQHYERRGFWGLVQTADETTLTGWSSSSNEVEPRQVKELGLPEGAVIRQNSDFTSNTGGEIFIIKGERVLSDRIYGQDRSVRRSGFLGWFKHITDRWKRGTSTLTLYNYTISASQPITIGLIGSETGSINIASTNAKGGSINLTGNVANSHNQATLTVSSAAGGITQFDNTTLKSEIVNLTAKDDIKNIHLASVGTKDANGNVTDNIQLTAVSSGMGDIDITAVGGELGGSLPGNVTIVALKSQDGNAFNNNAALGDVTLNATGNITQLGSGTTVEGRGITLTSKNGGIGTSGQAINIAGSDLVYSTDRYGAQVNASAKDSIYLTEADAGGDMRVGRIESMEGDVALTIANGGFIDGLQHVDKSGSTESVDEMVHRWIDAGLIDGEKDAQGNYTYKGAYITGLEKNRDDYKANVEAAYENYKANVAAANEVKNVYASEDYQNYLNKTGDYAGKTDEEIAAKLAADDHQKYADYKQYATAAEYLTANNMDWEAQYNTQKAAVEAVYDSEDYQNYLNKTGAYAGMTDEQKVEKLAADGHQDYITYAKYGSAEAYMQDSAAYKYSRFSQYENVGDCLAADATYTDLVNKAANPKFEWTKEMMLYAVSDKMVNPEGGGSTQTERSANVLGKHITLNAAKGAVGTFDDVTKTIEVDELNIAKMKELMNVSASDVKVDKDEAGNILRFRVKQNRPLGVFLKDNGTLTDNGTPTSRLDVQAGGDVFVAGRKNGEGDTGINSAINVGSIDATKKEGVTGNVRLHSDEGIYNAKTADDTNIKGNNLILTGGKESIGTAEKPLTVSLSGDMTEARADKDVYIKNMKADVLRLGAMSAKDTISLTSDKGFLMSNANGNIAESYINAGKSLVFIANAETGVVGDADHAIRILNDRAPVNITAGSAYIRGVDNSSIKNGTLLLGDITTAGGFTAVGDGSIAVGREEETDSSGNVVKEAVAGSITAGGDVTLDAKDKLTLDGTVTAGDVEHAKTLTMKAVNGNITQTDKGTIIADTVKTFNGKSLLLENTGNQFNNIIVDGITVVNSETGSEEKPAIAGDVRIKDNANALTVAVNRNVTGNISVENGGTLTNSGNITATGNIGLKADGNLTQAANTTFTAGKDVMLTSTNGAITTNGAVTANKSVMLTSTGGAVSTNGTVTAETEDVEVNAKGDVTTSGAVQAKNNVTFTSTEGAITTNNTLTAEKGNIAATAQGDVTTNGTLTAGTDVALTSTNGSLETNGNITATAGSIAIEAGSLLRQTSGTTFKAGKDVTLTSTGNSQEYSKSIQQYGTIDAGGNIILKAVKDVGTTNLTAGQNVTITAENGDIYHMSGKIDVKGSAIMNAGTNIEMTDLTAGENVELTAQTGYINQIGKVNAGGSASLYAGSNVLQQAGALLKAGKDVTMTAASGGIDQNGYAGVQAGNVTIASAKTVDLQGTGNQFDSITVQSSGENTPILGNVLIKDSADKLTLDLKSTVQTGKIDVENTKVQGTLQVVSELHAKGASSSDKGNITLKSKGNLQTDKKIDAENYANITSTNGAVAIDGDVSAGQSITLQSKDTMQTSGKLTATWNVNANSAGTMNINGAVTAEKGDITLQSKDTMQTTGTLTAKNDVKLTSTSGDVAINGNVTTGNRKPVNVDLVNGVVQETFNSLTITAGGAIREAAGVTIATPVVVTNSGNGVSMESVNNKFAVFSAEALEGKIAIDGSVKATTNYAGNEIYDFLIGVGADVKGDATFTNLANNGDLDIMILHPNNYDNKEIEVIGGNGADGSLTLTANGNVGLLGDAKAAYDIVINSANGSFDGISRGMKAGHDVSVTVEDSVNYIGGTIDAGNDINMQVKNPTFIDSGIYIGTLADGRTDTTSLKAGGDVHLDVQGKGHVLITGTVESVNESVSVTVGKGNIVIGTANDANEQTLKAKENITVGTNLGSILVQGEIITQKGDISVAAASEKYDPNATENNIAFTSNGKLTSGRDAYLIATNGDLLVTDDVTANGTFYAQTKGQGDITLENDLTVTNDLSMSTEIGDITVGKTVTAEQGSVEIQAGTGSILVGQDITAKENVSITTQKGHVGVGDLTTGEGDVRSKKGKVTIRTDDGTIGIVKTVKADEGSVGIASGKGDILIGSNGPSEKTVSAKQNVKVETDLGTITIQGKTSTDNGDITMKAGKDNYEPGLNTGNFIIEAEGEVDSGGAVTLNGRNGDIHITDDIKAKKGVNANIAEEGSVYFDRDVTVTNDVNIATEKGNIAVGKTITSTAGSVNLKTGEGEVLIGQDITAEKDVSITNKDGDVIVGDLETGDAGHVLSKTGNVSIQADNGIVGIVKSVKAQEGNIDVQVGTGGVIIGNNGPGVETVTAQKNINVDVNVGQVKIYGKTSTKTGDIAMSAGANTYTPGDRNFIIEQNGLLESGQDISLTGRNGDLHVTDAIQANRNLYAQVLEEGGVFFEKSAALTGDVRVHTDSGPISIAGAVDANLVDLSAGQGDISVGKDINSAATVQIGTGAGNVSLQNVTAGGDVNVSAGTGNVSTQNITSQQNVAVTVGQGNINTANVTAAGNANLAVQNGDIRMHDVNAQGNATVTSTNSGSINGNDVISAGTTHVALANGDLFLNLAEGKAVVLQMENNTAASRVNRVLADTNGAGLDVDLTGNYIQVGTVAARGGNSVFQLSAMGAGNQKLISGAISVDSLRSGSGTHMPYLWANRGDLHVDEGDLAVDDVLAMDKIHMENEQTTLAIYGRTPTRDGEQLVYWNNVDMANSNLRAFRLYTDGKVRTRGAILIDAGRNYGKLYGDNLSVVDMMRERVTNEHGQYTFDSAWLTEPGRLMREPVLSAVGSSDVIIQFASASDAEIIID